jgi:hypothetical protein
LSKPTPMEYLIITAIFSLMAVGVVAYTSQQSAAAHAGDIAYVDREVSVPKYELLIFSTGEVRTVKVGSPCKLLHRYSVIVYSSGPGEATGIVSVNSQKYYTDGACPVNAVVTLPLTSVNLVSGRF